MNTQLKALASFCILAVGLHVPCVAEKSEAEEKDQALSTLPMVSAVVSNREIRVIYNIPEGQHATVGESYNFMTIHVPEIPGMKFGETVYPKGKKDADGNTEHHGVVILTKSITVLPEFDFSTQTVSITAGYQLCLDSGVCLPPKKETFDLTFTLEKQSP